jgi:hypothetical protein
MSETHEMRLVGKAASGAEEWLCPTCLRRVLIEWPPHYEMVVLERGDESVAHAGGRGGLSITRFRPVRPLLTSPPTPGPEDLRWLYEIGIDWDGSGSAA